MVGDSPDTSAGGSAAQLPPTPRPTPETSAPALRIGDAERHRVIGELRTQVGDGRLSLDEFAERADQVWRATTALELAPVLADLPAVPTTVSPPAGPVRPAPALGPEAATMPTRGRRSIVAVMSGTRVRGRWHVAPQITVTAFWGSAHVDLRDAIFMSPVVDINAVAIMGSITVTVPEGIPVELDGTVLMGGCHNRTPADLVLPGAPVVRVHAMGMWADIDVRSRPSGVTEVPSELAPPPTTPEPPDATRPAPGPAAVADRTRPDPAAAPRALPTGTLTMLFTDIVGSTPLVEELGDQRWSQVMRDHDTAVRAVVASHAGTVVKGEGDGYLIVFVSARQAVLAALGLQRAVQDLDHDLPGRRLAIRTGLHTGEVVAQEGDVFGRNVIAAARIAAEAAPGQVLVSSLTKELVDSSGDLSFDEGREIELRGLARPWRIHTVRS